MFWHCKTSSIRKSNIWVPKTHFASCTCNVTHTNIKQQENSGEQRIIYRTDDEFNLKVKSIDMYLWFLSMNELICEKIH